MDSSSSARSILSICAPLGRFMREGIGFFQHCRAARLHPSHSGPSCRRGMTAAPASPFFRIGPERPVSPVVLSIPHAGRDYRPELLRAARLPQAALETLEDRLVDRLVWRGTANRATALGAPGARGGS